MKNQSKYQRKQVAVTCVDCKQTRLIDKAKSKQHMPERCLSCSYKHSYTIKHGQAKTRIWRIWMNMKARCKYPNIPTYKYYGGRGIIVCERWQNFDNFLADMGNDYADNLSIDRIDTNGNYEPSNCRWATRSEQAKNRRYLKEYKYGQRGVRPLGSKWAVIVDDKFRGQFVTIEEARTVAKQIYNTEYPNTLPPYETGIDSYESQ